MFPRWPLRKKLSLGVTILFLIMGIMSFSGFRGVYAFRDLTKGLRTRATELPLVAELAHRVRDLRVSYTTCHRAEALEPGSLVAPYAPTTLGDTQFRNDMLAVQDALGRYKAQLVTERIGDRRIADNHQERETVNALEQSLKLIEEAYQHENWLRDAWATYTLDNETLHLQELSSRLPEFMTKRLYGFSEEARTQYRIWIGMASVSTFLAVAMLLLLMQFFQTSIFRPLQVLIQGSRRVAGGDFDHRIHVDTQDEVAELAGAMNEMTTRFREIRDDLDAQVKQRTKEVVRSEQLASVGFLAAGVAHEINNPLASIAWSAESLESRLHDIIQQDDEKPDDEHNEEITILRKYLRRIQDEAFRCKGITEKLLDFSRLGDRQKHETELGEQVQAVIDMVQHLGKYRNKQIHFERKGVVVALVNPQEFKQVVLNLVTNALDSLDSGGVVTVTLVRAGAVAELVVTDTGCGMTAEVMEHLYEPFFTRRRGGQGTGLGLSITYRIVEDHGGTIRAYSDGPGRGSQFRVTLPLTEIRYGTERERAFQAA